MNLQECPTKTTSDAFQDQVNRNSLRKKRLRLLRLLHINIQSMRNKISELEAYLAAKEPNIDVICVSEHWLQESEIQYIKVGEFTVASHFARTEFTHGGTLILLNKSLESYPLLNLNKFSIEKHCEIAAAKIKNLNITILTIYRSPIGDFNVFIDTLEKLLISVNSNQMIICGDFNVKFNTGNHQDVTLTDLFKTFGLEQTIRESTREANCIDNIFINFSTDDYNSYSSESFLSDHKSVILEVTTFNHFIKYKKTCRPITETGKYIFYEQLAGVTWDFSDDGSLDINTKWNMLLDTILLAYNESFPEKLLSFKNNNLSQPSWFTNGDSNHEGAFKFFK